MNNKQNTNAWHFLYSCYHNERNRAVKIQNRFLETTINVCKCKITKMYGRGHIEEQMAKVNV